MIRPYYWSLRRELWENRSLIFAPIAMASVVMFSCFISAVMLPHRMRTLITAPPARQIASLNSPFNFAAGMLVITACFVGAFYCVDALYSERRDRSILFWKSLPVADRTAVLAKASIPAIVLPVITYALILVIHVFTWMLSAMVLAGRRQAFELFWNHVHVSQLWVAILFALIAIVLWLAPAYTWLLLVSAWAKRVPLLWAVLPLLAIAMFEYAAFHSSLFFHFLGYRFTGWFKEGFIDPKQAAANPVTPIEAIRLANFLSTPGLWIGLMFAAVFLFAAIKLRHDREPI